MKEKCSNCKEWIRGIFDPDSDIPKKIQEDRCVLRRIDRKGNERACSEFKPNNSYKPWKSKRRDWEDVKNPHGTKGDARGLHR
jgi:hypothetical protein